MATGVRGRRPFEQDPRGPRHDVFGPVRARLVHTGESNESNLVVAEPLVSCCHAVARMHSQMLTISFLTPLLFCLINPDIHTVVSLRDAAAAENHSRGFYSTQQQEIASRNRRYLCPPPTYTTYSNSTMHYFNLQPCIYIFPHCTLSISVWITTIKLV